MTGNLNGSDLFFYGRLVHLPLLEVVLGRKITEGEILPASLADHGVFQAEGEDYSLIQACPKARADGNLITGLSPADMARLNYYEGGFGYKLSAHQVKTDAGMKTAHIYFPVHPVSGNDKLWQFALWREQWAELAVLAADEAMAHFGQISAQVLLARYPAMQRRAASKLRARQTQDRRTIGRELGRDDVRVCAHSHPYSNFFAMQEYSLRFRKFDGGLSNEIDRAVFTGFDVAMVLPYDPVLDQVLLVEQFRLGPYARGAALPWVLEPIAGHVDVGETPEDAARRETVEEAGLELRDLLPIANAYPSPGCSTEYYHIYLGLCNLAGLGRATAGLRSENEDIRSHTISFTTLLEMVDRFEANNQPLILAAYWLARNRARLRSGA